MARIGINGFGRIGRYLVRLMAERNEFPVVINARADNASLAHLFKYDSVHHTFKGTVGHDENGIIINGTHIAVTRCKPNEWQWKDYGVDLVVESTGTIKKRAGLAEGKYSVEYLEPELSWAQELALNVKSQIARSLGGALLPSGDAALLQAARRLEPLQREALRWSRMATPNHVYAYCFCSAH